MTSEFDKTLNQDSEYSLTPFFELSADLLCIAGFDGYFREVNPALCKLLQYSKKELLARPVDDFIHENDRHITGNHRENIKSGTPLLNFENRYIKKDGSIVWLSWTSIPVNDSELVYAIAKNITHKKTHEEERNRLLSKLTQTNNKLKQLNYATAHDLRSPVSNLLTIFNLLDLTRIQDSETLEFIDLLKSTTENIRDTLNNYVDDLNQDHSLQVKITELDLKTVLDVVLQSLHSIIEDSKTTIFTEFEEFTSVLFNKSYLESIFLNLITNSIKYADPNRDPVITIRSKISDQSKTLIFSDNGQGFDSDDLQDKIFGLRQTFHNHPDAKGIGLYLVYNHINSLGGEISVQSKPNEGAAFTLTFKD